MSADKHPPEQGPIDDDLDEHAREMLRQVSLRRARIERYRREGDRSFWSNLGLIGVVGWGVIIPALIGGFLGRYLDRHFEAGTVWTLSLLMLGLGVGCLNAWHIIHQRRD